MTKHQNGHDVVTVEHSSLNITAMEALIAQAAVEGPQAVSAFQWNDLVKMLYHDVIVAYEKATTMAFDDDPEPEALFPDFLPRRGPMPDTPRAKTLVYDHGGKVITSLDVMQVRGLRDIRPDSVQPLMEQMVREGWAKVHAYEQRSSGSFPTAWEVRPDPETRSKVPTDGITFHICEHFGGHTVGISHLHDCLSQVAMSQSIQHTRDRIEAAVGQGWATPSATRDDDTVIAWNIKALPEGTFKTKEQP